MGYTLIENNDIESWTNATLIAFKVFKDTSLLILVIQTAVYFNQYEYINFLYEKIEFRDPKMLDEFRKLVDQIISLKFKEPVTVRMFKDDGKYVSFQL